MWENGAEWEEAATRGVAILFFERNWELIHLCNGKRRCKRDTSEMVATKKILHYLPLLLAKITDLEY